MPGQTLSSGSLGSCAIAGARLAATASTRAALATDKVFISDLIQVDASVVRACRPRWSGSPFEVGRRACRAMPIETGARRLLFLRPSEFGVRTSAEEHGDGFHGGGFGRGGFGDPGFRGGRFRFGGCFRGRFSGYYRGF